MLGLKVEMKIMSSEGDKAI